MTAQRPNEDSKTGTALAVGIGAVAVVGLGVYLLGSRKTDPFKGTPFEITTPPGYRTWKFDTERGHVKIQHPGTGVGNERQVESVLRWYPPGSYPLSGVQARLREIGAKFVPWAHGDPGDTGFWNEIDLEQMKKWKGRRESARTAASAKSGAVNLKVGEHFKFAGD
jgi:hypothetical protein